MRKFWDFAILSNPGIEKLAVISRFCWLAGSNCSDKCWCCSIHQVSVGL